MSHLDDVGHVLCPSPREITTGKIDCLDACGVLHTLANDFKRKEKGKTMRTSISTLMCVSIKLYLNINMHTFQALI